MSSTTTPITPDPNSLSIIQTMYAAASTSPEQAPQHVHSRTNSAYLESEAGPSNGKRRKEGEPNGSAKKKQRTRVSYSCSECHRRKQKCDRQMPCSHCIARKVPELCKGYTPGKSDSDLNARLSRVEQIVEMALPQFSSRISSSVPQSPSEDDDDSMHGEEQGEENDPAGGFLQSGRWFGASASGSVTTQPLLEQLHQGPDFPAAAEDNHSPTEKLMRLIQDCGVSSTKMPELLRELPESKATCDRFVDYYFQSINYTRYPLYEPTFRASYESIYANGGKVHPNDIRFLPLLFVMLAISVRLAPDHIVGNATLRRLTSLRYYWASRRSLLIAAAVQTDSLELVLARLLSFRFLIFERRITECWAQLGAAVRTAQALGLHRDGTKLGLDPYNTEYRRRVWTYLYHADRTHALLLGRPPSISDDYTDTHPPSNIPDTVLPSAAVVMPAPEPLTKPTRMTFQILRHGLAAIIGHIVHHFQNLRGHSSYAEVHTLDAELEHFTAHLPPAYSLDPDTSMDHDHHYVPVHRFLIITEVFFVRMSLHRPYLLRKHERYSLSRRASFQCAKLDFKVRQAFKRSVSRDVLISLGGAYREFQAAMTAGISLMLDADGPDSDEMRQILDVFIRDHTNMEYMDETTKRELKVIELLQSKAGSARPPPPMKNESEEHSIGAASADAAREYSPSPLDAQATANILLNISQTLPPSSSVPSPFASSGNISPQAHMTTSGTSFIQYRHPMSLNNDTATLSGSQPPFPNYHRVLTRPRLDQANGPSLSPTLSTEEQEQAQALLDRWCDTASGSVDAMDKTASGWSLGDGLGPSMGFDSIGDTPGMPGQQEEWAYWENLVETIRGGGSVVGTSGQAMG